MPLFVSHATSELPWRVRQQRKSEAIEALRKDSASVAQITW